MARKKRIGNKNRSSLSDNDLVQFIREKDSQKYVEIIKRYQGKLLVYLYRLIGSRQDAEDILQNVFIKAYKDLYKYDVKRKFSSWIYRIAHNEAVNYLKRKSLKKFIPWENIITTKDQLKMSHSSERPDKIWFRKETSQEVNRVLDKLPLKYKRVLILRYYSRKSYKEISKILGKPVNTVGILIHRAKKKIICGDEKANKKK
ncbi:MAG TPA: RNA polymerase sigma factor [Candidatus Moranbacteria bacterium]|nr:RNA polymerase sigma factor [Candidatus Moranbacteria bacterium]